MSAVRPSVRSGGSLHAGAALSVVAVRQPTPLAATRNNRSRMNIVLAITHQTGRKLAEVGFLLILFAGIWLAAAQIALFKLAAARTIIAGIALAIAGVLLIIATHWGGFG